MAKPGDSVISIHGLKTQFGDHPPPDVSRRGRLAKLLADEGALGEAIAGFEDFGPGADEFRLAQRARAAPGESASGWQRAEFADVFLLSRKFKGTQQISPARLEGVLKFFDDVTEPTANSVLHYWRRDPHYAKAIEEVGEAPKPSEMS